MGHLSDEGERDDVQSLRKEGGMEPGVGELMERSEKMTSTRRLKSGRAGWH